MLAAAWETADDQMDVVGGGRLQRVDHDDRLRSRDRAEDDKRNEANGQLSHHALLRRESRKRRSCPSGQAGSARPQVISYRARKYCGGPLLWLGARDFARPAGSRGDNEGHSHGKFAKGVELKMRVRCAPAVFALGLFWPAVASAAVRITPATPTTGDRVTIRVENSFGSEARATSASITQTGNTFVIQQNVELACLLPSSPIVASEFQVGPLPPGTYIVAANIVFTSVDPIPCTRPPVAQAASFTVTPGADIPAISPIGLLLLGVVFAAASFVALRG